MNIPWSKTRIGTIAGLAAGTAGLVVAAGLGPGPSLLSASSSNGDDDSSTSETSTTAAAAGNVPPGAASRVVDAGPAGTVTVAESGGTLTLVSVTPGSGWTSEIEQAFGREVEVDFRQGTQRVQVSVEIEDGAVRERLRFRDEATGTDVTVENGVVVRAEGPGTAGLVPAGGAGNEGDDDGPGDDDSGHGDSGHGDDDGPGDDDGGDDDSRSGRSDDGHGTDDRGGEDDGGADD